MTAEQHRPPRCPKHRDPTLELACLLGTKRRIDGAGPHLCSPARTLCCVLFFVRSSGSRLQVSERPQESANPAPPGLKPLLCTLHLQLLEHSVHSEQGLQKAREACTTSSLCGEEGRGGISCMFPVPSWGRAVSPGPQPPTRHCQGHWAAGGSSQDQLLSGGWCLQGSHAEMTLNVCGPPLHSLMSHLAEQSTALSPTLLTMSCCVLQLEHRVQDQLRQGLCL